MSGAPLVARTGAAAPEHGLGVIVNHHAWLALTENWIHTQTTHVLAGITPYVVCDRVHHRADFEVAHLFAYEELPRLERLRLLSRALPRLGRALGRKAALIAHVADRYGARLVHSHFGHTASHCARAVRRLGLKHVVTFYGADMSALPTRDPRWAQRYRALFPLVDRVLCEGPHMAERIRALGCPADKVQVHHLGVDLRELPFRPRAWRPGKTLRVLLAASFREKKGFPYAIEALAYAKRMVPLEITIIGDASSDPRSREEKSKIFAAVEHAGLAREVTFLGYQPHDVLMREAYRHHVFVSPSVTAADGDTEGGAPVALLEMAASGMPIVSSRHADIPNVIEHGVTGLLAGERDVAELAAHLRRLIEHPQAWDAMVAAGRRRIETEFDAATQGAALTSIYRELDT